MEFKKRLNGDDYWGFRNSKCVICNNKALPGLFRCQKCTDQFVAEMPDEAPKTCPLNLASFNRIRRDMA